LSTKTIFTFFIILLLFIGVFLYLNPKPSPLLPSNPQPEAKSDVSVSVSVGGTEVVSSQLQPLQKLSFMLFGIIPEPKRMATVDLASEGKQIRLYDSQTGTSQKVDISISVVTKVLSGALKRSSATGTLKLQGLGKEVASWSISRALASEDTVTFSTDGYTIYSKLFPSEPTQSQQVSLVGHLTLTISHTFEPVSEGSPPVIRSQVFDLDAFTLNLTVTPTPSASTTVASGLAQSTSQPKLEIQPFWFTTGTWGRWQFATVLVDGLTKKGVNSLPLTLKYDVAPPDGYYELVNGFWIGKFKLFDGVYDYSKNGVTQTIQVPNIVYDGQNYVVSGYVSYDGAVSWGGGSSFSASPYLLYFRVTSPGSGQYPAFDSGDLATIGAVG
jgi:hypothetical protein